MKRMIFVLLAVFMASGGLKAEMFFGFNEEGETIRYSGSATVIDVVEWDCCIAVTLANKYYTHKADTIVKNISQRDVNVFLRYLSIGDKIDFSLCSEPYAYIRRIRLNGDVNPYFVKNKVGCGIAKVARVRDDGVIILENGIVIRKPKRKHKVGDMVAYRDSPIYFLMGIERRKRVQ